VTKDSQLYIGDGRKPFKVGHLFMLQGKDHVELARGVPGDLCAVAKVDEMHFDAVLHDAAEDDHIHLKPLDFPVPVHGLAIEPRRRGDEQRLWDILQKLVDEDPCLKVEHVVATNETVVYGLGDLHLRTLLERLTEVHRCEVNTRPPRIAYRETISQPAEGHHRHKKQTGGAGQFGEVFLRVEPLPRGAGFEFVDQVKGGTIPGNFMPAVEKGVRQALTSGVVAGHSVIDVRVTVYDGKHHSVDSKEIAFITAGRKALIDAVQKAAPIVLEPIVNVEITAPDANIGDVTGDLSSRRGQVSGTRNAAAGLLAVLGQAPLAELSSYQSRLNAMTGGQGRYTLAFSHYEAVPPTVQAQLVSQYKVKDEE
jgi:elongation factor G